MALFVHRSAHFCGEMASFSSAEASLTNELLDCEQLCQPGVGFGARVCSRRKTSDRFVHTVGTWPPTFRCPWRIQKWGQGSLRHGSSSSADVEGCIGPSPTAGIHWLTPRVLHHRTTKERSRVLKPSVVQPSSEPVVQVDLPPCRSSVIRSIVAHEGKMAKRVRWARRA